MFALHALIELDTNENGTQLTYVGLCNGSDMSLCVFNLLPQLVVDHEINLLKLARKLLRRFVMGIVLHHTFLTGGCSQRCKRGYSI